MALSHNRAPVPDTVTITQDDLRTLLGRYHMDLSICTDCGGSQDSARHEPFCEPLCRYPEEHHNYNPPFDALWAELCDIAPRQDV
jgi:hypothetical protein